MTTATLSTALDQGLEHVEPAAVTADAVKNGTTSVTPPVARPAPRGPSLGERLGGFMRRVIPPFLGLALVLGVWALVAMKSAAVSVNIGVRNSPGPAFKPGSSNGPKYGLGPGGGLPVWLPPILTSKPWFMGQNLSPPKCHLPTEALRYPAGLSRSAVVVSESFNSVAVRGVIIGPCSCEGLPGIQSVTPVRTGYLPVRMLARVGEQTGQAA